MARIFNTYGPGMRADDGRVISNFVTQAIRGEPLTVYGDGSQTRSLCYVDDWSPGCWPCSTRSAPARSTSAATTSVLCSRWPSWCSRCPAPTSGIVFTPRPVDDPSRRCPDLTRARQRARMEPRAPLSGTVWSAPSSGSMSVSTGEGHRVVEAAPIRSAGPVTVSRVVAIVVNYNAAGLVGACLDSFAANGVDTVIVVDNGSADGSRPGRPRDGGAGGCRPAPTSGTGGPPTGGRRPRSSGGPLPVVCNPDLRAGPGRRRRPGRVA